MRWMEIAWSQVGIAETPGAAATVDIVKYFRDAGRADITSDETAWCAAFLNACLARAGVSLEAIPHNDRLLARKCLLLGTEIREPRVGGICVVTRGADPTFGHTGFITAWTETEIELLNGNVGNTVCVSRFPRSQIVGMRWPEAPATAKEVAEQSRIAAAAQQQQKDGMKSGGGIGAEQMVPPVPKKLPGLQELGNYASSFKSIIQTLEAFILFAWSKLPLLIGIVVVYWLARMAWNAWRIKHWRTEDHNTGKTDAPANEVPDGQAG